MAWNSKDFVPDYNTRKKKDLFEFDLKIYFGFS